MCYDFNIEEYFESKAKNDDVVSKLFKSYNSIKELLSEKYYPWIRDQCPYYTNHGKLHVDSVIDSSSKLLQLSIDKLSDVEVFLLLTSIVYHDVAMIKGRIDHHINASEIISRYIDLMPSRDFARIVNEIIKAHSGKNGLAIPSGSCGISIKQRSQEVRPKLIASILRFADEVSENRTRVEEVIIDEVPNESQIFWRYAMSISASIPKPIEKKISVTISIDYETLAEEYVCKEFCNRVTNGQINIIKYIICRLEKMNNERIYCSHIFSELVDIKEIEAELTVVKGIERVEGIEVINFSFRDVGLYEENKYPNVSFYDNFFSNHSHWPPIASLNKQ
ncbi:hypothetical protein [Desulfoluna sp.]|uniref:HD domain-containing protein n=1 Tax=Desulfoluna sp. TaxID=2045199 RepID=UPI002636A36D|nr:hypothetical protein [Desulfoluna sp.]